LRSSDPPTQLTRLPAGAGPTMLTRCRLAAHGSPPPARCTHDPHGARTGSACRAAAIDPTRMPGFAPISRFVETYRKHGDIEYPWYRPRRGRICGRSELVFSARQRDRGEAARRTVPFCMSGPGRWQMDLLLMTSAQQPTTEVLPALGLLSHTVRVAVPEVSVLLDTPAGDVILIDARHNLAAGRTLSRLLEATGVAAPVFGVLTEGGLVSLSSEWTVDDVLLDTAGPAEAEARLRFALAR